MTTLRDIARLLRAEVEGDATLEIRRVAKIEEAGEGDITFLANPKYLKFLGLTRASAVIVGGTLARPAELSGGPALVKVDDPYAAFLKVLVTFNPPADPLPPGIHPTAVVDPSATLGADVRIGALAYVGPRSHIGNGAMIGYGTIVGRDVTIGPGTLIHSGVSVRDGCLIGARVIVQPGAVIGSDGFGFAPLPDGSYEKIPQVGIVVIEDDVEIGANTTIDRATMGETRIMKGAKLDNLIQIAHNVVVGEHSVIAAQTGISGSTKIGRHAMIGGQVGITGHLELADGIKIGAQSGVHRSVQESNVTLFGYPAYPHRQALRIQGAIVQLPDLVATVREMGKTIEEMKRTIEELNKELGTKNSGEPKH